MKIPTHLTLYAAYFTLLLVHYTLHTVLSTKVGNVSALVPSKVKYTLYIVHCALRSANGRLHTVHCTLNSAHFIMHTIYSTLHTAHYIQHTAHCTQQPKANCALFVIQLGGWAGCHAIISYNDTGKDFRIF